ncbi:unnamed protein product [Amoebophrya sp. A120]|nr:unnamed protein product [Amoebophrya sp. A120]|eukprot:GSA120T00010069001.1
MPMWGSMPFFSKKTLIAVWWASLVGEVEGTGAAAGSADLPAQPVNEDKRFDPTKPFKIRFPRAKGIMVTEMQGSDNLQAMFDKEATSRQAQGAQDSGAAAAQALVDLAEQIESQTMEMVLVHHDAAEGQEHEVPGGVRHEVPNADRNIYWCGKIIFSHKIKMFDTIATAEHEEAASQKCLKMSEPREGDSGDKRRDLLLVPDNGACSDLCIGGIADRPSLRSQWEIATPNGNILERNADRRVLVADKDKFDTLKDTDLMNPDSVAGLRSNAGDLRPAIQLTKRPHAAENGWPRNLEILQERPTSGGDGGTIWIGTTSPAHQGANQMYFAAPAVSAPEEPARARGDPEPGGAGGAGGGPADPVLPGLVAPPQAAAAAAAETAAPAAAPPAGPGSPPPAAPPRPRTRAVLSDQPVSVAIDINDPSHPLHPHYQSPAAKRGAAPALPDTGGVEDKKRQQLLNHQHSWLELLSQTALRLRLSLCHDHHHHHHHKANNNDNHNHDHQEELWS